MNDLSFLRGPHMGNFILRDMEDISNEKLSWEDIQGLSWMIEEFSFEINEKVSTYTCAPKPRAR